jgi:WD40 repeat protein
MVFESNQGEPLANMREAGGSTRVAFSADGKTIAGVFNGNSVRVFAAGSDRSKAQLNDCVVRDLSLSSDGRRLAVGCQDDRQVRIMDIPADRVVGKVPYRSQGRLANLAISPDGKMVFSGATVFEAEGQDRVVRDIGQGGNAAVAFDPSARHLAVAASGMGAAVYETSGDQKLKRFGGDYEFIDSVAFSPDGKRLALGVYRSTDNYTAVIVYDIDTSQPVARLEHKQEETERLQVSSMVFSPDGQMLASAAIDPTRPGEEQLATLRVFNIMGKVEILRVPSRDTDSRSGWLGREKLHLIGFSPDQAFLEIAVGDKDIRLVRFPIRAQDLIEDACSRVTRNLKPAEWARYLPDTPYRETCPKLNPAAVEVE